MENMWRQVLQGKEYRAVMEQIDNCCSPDVHTSFGSWHGLSHAIGVMKHTENILRQLGESDYALELGRVAALLHDIALRSGDKTDHARLSSEQAKYFLDKLEIPEADKELIRTAIRKHSEGDETMNNIDMALLLADKLDVDKTRLRPNAKRDSIQAEMEKIEKVEYIIDAKTATLKYRAAADLDLDGFLEWPKSLAIPRKAAKHMNREFKFFVNDQEIGESRMDRLLSGD